MNFRKKKYAFKIIIINLNYQKFVEKDESIKLDSFFEDLHIFYDDFNNYSEILVFKYILKFIIEFVLSNLLLKR